MPKHFTAENWWWNGAAVRMNELAEMNPTTHRSMPDSIVSIGLPVYNGERFLAQTINSILAQTFSDLELIISDNASVDESRAIAESYARQDNRVRIVQNEVNKGAAWNYKHVVDLARGRYFRWAPADDLFAPESLACCVEVLDRYSDVVLCYPKTTLIDARGEEIAPYEDNLDLRQPNPVERYKAAIKQMGMMNVIYGLMRTDVLRQTRLIGNYPGADLIFVAELALFGKFYEIKRRLFFRRLHAGASSSIQEIQETQAFFDPRTRESVLVPVLKQHLEYLRSIVRGPLATHEKRALIAFVLRQLISDRDQLFREMLFVFAYRKTPRLR